MSIEGVTCPWTLAGLLKTFPGIRWPEPIRVSSLDGSDSGFACRVCVANRGLHGSEVRELFPTEEQARAHVQQVHP
jgi:hypothetical protein